MLCYRTGGSVANFIAGTDSLTPWPSIHGTASTWSASATYGANGALVHQSSSTTDTMKSTDSSNYTSALVHVVLPQLPDYPVSITKGNASLVWTKGTGLQLTLNGTTTTLNTPWLANSGPIDSEWCDKHCFAFFLHNSLPHIGCCYSFSMAPHCT
jgi:hypothetical protein